MSASRLSPLVQPLESRVLLSALVTGLVFNDIDGNGRRSKREPGVGNVAVYIDANANGARDAPEMAVTTGVKGSYSFAGLAPGNYSIRALPPEDMQGGAGGASTVAVVTTRSRAKAAPIALVGRGRISGEVFYDNFSFVPGSPIPDIRVFLDRNGDGARQKSERLVRTDTEGRYAFTGLTAGSYRVRVLSGRYRGPTNGSFPVVIDANGWSKSRDVGVIPRGLV